jgi:hypothetical protein
MKNERLKKERKLWENNYQDASEFILLMHGIIKP